MADRCGACCVFHSLPCLNVFSGPAGGKNKKNIINMSSADLDQRVEKVKSEGYY